MAATRKITVELPGDVAREIDAKVASGFSETPEAFVRESVETSLSDQAIDVGRWVRDKVAPAYDEWKTTGESGIPADQVFDGVMDRYLARKAAG